MTVNERGNVLSQIDRSQRSSVDDIEESQIENPVQEPTKVINDDNVEDEEIEEVGEDVKRALQHDSYPDSDLSQVDVKGKGENAVPVDTTIKEGKEENTNDLVAEKRTNGARSSSARNKGNLQNKFYPDSDAEAGFVADGSKTSSLKQDERFEDKELPVRTKGRKDEDPVKAYSTDAALFKENILGTSVIADDASINDHSVICSSGFISSETSSQMSIPGAFAVETPMHKSSIRQEILELSRSMPLAGSSDSNSNVEETHDFHETPTASVILASSSTRQQSREDPEMGQHVVEAVCVQDQNIVEATIVTDGDDQDLGRQRSIRALLFIAALVLLGIVTVSLIVVFTKQNQADSPIDISTATESLDNVERIDALREILAPLSGDNVFDENSPEFSLERRLALSWMVRDTLLDIDDPSIEWKIRQRYIIALFYISTDGSRWKEQFYFDSGLDECDWSSVISPENNAFVVKGIVCNRQGRIERIRLWWNNLSGTLPHELSEFSESLVEIGVGGGSISGHIPRSFEQLTNLETFTLHDNCLTGVIPDLSDAVYLKTLWLSNNDGLSGSLNNFCNGSEVVAPLSSVSADCRGSVECDCCNCCNQDIYECCLQDGTCTSSINLSALTPNNVLSSFDRQCLSEKSKQWIREECPCFYNIYNGTEGDDAVFQAVCTTDCNAEGASPSYDF